MAPAHINYSLHCLPTFRCLVPNDRTELLFSTGAFMMVVLGVLNVQQLVQRLKIWRPLFRPLVQPR